MKQWLLACSLLTSAVCAHADTVGVVSGNNVIMVPATADAVVMQCKPTSMWICWPSWNNTGPSVALGSLPPSAYVWASINGAPVNWVLASQVTFALPAAPPLPPVNQQYNLVVNGSISLNGQTVSVDGVTGSLSSMNFTTQFGPFASLAACQAYYGASAQKFLAGGSTFTPGAGAAGLPVTVTLTANICAVI